MKLKWIAAGAVGAIGAVAVGAAVGASPAIYAANASLLAANATVTPGNMQGWATDPTENPPVFSADKPRSGNGVALKFDTPATNDRVSLRHAPPAQKLNDVTSLSYDYYKVGTVGAATVAYQIEIDSNGAAASDATGGYLTLTNERYRQPGGVVPDAWTSSGELATTSLWSSTATGRARLPLVTFTDELAPFAAIKAAYPDAVVLSVIVKQGAGNANTLSYADMVEFNDVTWNFEGNPVPPTPPLVKPTITVTTVKCGTVDVRVAVPAGAAPVRAIIRANNRTYAAPTVQGGTDYTYRFVFKEDSRDPSGAVRAEIKVFYEAPVGSTPVLGPTRFAQTDCKR